jgi:hypothetical protein
VIKVLKLFALKKAGSVTEVGVKQTEAQKYATEIIIRFKEYDHYLREYHESFSGTFS